MPPDVVANYTSFHPAAPASRPAGRHAATSESTIAIGLLLPEVLGTYSDAGNAAVLAQRARWRGIPAEILILSADATPPATCDVYLLGGGENTAQLFAADWLRRHTQLRHALDTRAQTLAVCAGLQILGQSMRDRSGHHHPGLGVLDVSTAPGRHRAVGEIITSCVIPGIGQLIGFENHRGLTTVGAGTGRLATVLTGTGNGTTDQAGRRTEGVHTERVIGTYLHVEATWPPSTSYPTRPRCTYLGPPATRRRIHIRRRLPKRLTHQG